MPKKGEGDGHGPQTFINFLTDWIAQLNRAQPVDQWLARWLDQLVDQPEDQPMDQWLAQWLALLPFQLEDQPEDQPEDQWLAPVVARP